MDSIIKSDNTIALIAISFTWVSFAIVAEQKWKWASKITGTVICMAGAIILTNLHIIPMSAPFFDTVIWDYAIPLAIPLLLFKCNIKKIWKESGRLLALFLSGSAGSAIFAIVAYNVFKDKIPSLKEISAMMTGSYIGGSVNLAAISSYYKTSAQLTAAATVADNVLMALYFFVLLFLSSSPFVKRHFPHPHIDKAEREGNLGAKTQAAAFWAPKKISLKDIAIALSSSALIVWASTELSAVFGALIPTGNIALDIINALFSSRYLIMTSISMILATFLSDKVKPDAGTQELGTFMIYLFFFAVGVPASIGQILKNAPLLFAFCAIIVFGNMIFCFVAGLLLGYSLEDIILASNANIGGPTTAAAMAISKGWQDLTGPVLLVGTLGYAIGTYFGIFVGKILGA